MLAAVTPVPARHMIGASRMKTAMRRFDSGVDAPRARREHQERREDEHGDRGPPSGGGEAYGACDDRDAEDGVEDGHDEPEVVLDFDGHPRLERAERGAEAADRGEGRGDLRPERAEVGEILLVGGARCDRAGECRGRGPRGLLRRLLRLPGLHGQDTSIGSVSGSMLRT